MRRLLAAMCGTVIVLLTPGLANASCAPIPGHRADRLARIAAGHGDNDVAFIGRVVERRKAVQRGDSVWSPVVFRVVASFKGGNSRERTVLVNGGCIKGSCVSNGEVLGYGGHHLQLVLADRRQRVGLVSVLDCSDAGPLSAQEVTAMLHPSVLPMTGGGGLSGLTTFGGAMLVTGFVLVVAVRRRRADGEWVHDMCP